MSTSLILGAVGGMVGNALLPGIGGQIGFLVGSLLGNLIDPPKVEGPRRSDLKLQVSEYGRSIPYVWGTGRLAGVVIDQTDLEEHKETSGGKGGPEIITYTYSASFAIALAHRLPTRNRAILGVLRIWADARLIWDETTGEDMPCTLYVGTVDQEPDPTFEAIHGIGQQPAYRNTAYVVFADYMLTDFGDRIPALEFEVYTGEGDFPWRVSHFDVQQGVSGDRCVEYAEGVITVGVYRTASLPNGIYYERQYDLQGVEVTDSYFEAELSPSGFPTQSVQGITIATDGVTWWYKQNAVGSILTNPFGGSVEQVINSAQSIVYYNGYIFGTGGSTVNGDIGVVRFPVIDNVPATAPDASVITSNISGGDSLSNWIVGKTNVTDRCYVWSNFTTTLYEYEFDLSGVTRQWDLTTVNGVEAVVNGYGFTVYLNRDDELILASDRGNTGAKNTGAFLLGSDLSVTFVGQVDAVDGYVTTVSQLGNSGYVLVDDGVVSLVPPPASELLYEIVNDLSSMTSLTGEGSPATDAYDTSELTDEVRWFAVASQMTVRNAIDTLRRVYFFDAAEIDDLVVFKKRGATDSVVTIDDDDLVAREYGADEGDPLLTTRIPEAELPRTVTLRYIDVDMDYQPGAQSSPRLTTRSESDVSIDVAVGLTADEALQKCWALQVSEWVEREKFEWTTTRKYAWVAPCDVVTVRGRVVRVTARTLTPAGVISWQGVLHRPSIYTQTAEAGEAPGWTPQVPPAAKAATTLRMLDIPLLDSTHYPNGYYAALSPAAEGPWTGAALYKSVDGGASYTSIAETVSGAVVGTVAVALGDFAGGNVFDHLNTITVVLSDSDMELSSATETAVLNGANLCALGSEADGWEVLQFTTATLTVANTYTLSGLLRGRYGTERLMGDHATNETLILLSGAINVNGPFAELYSTRQFKGVSFGTTVAAATAVDFSNDGVALKPFAPVLLGGGRDSSDDLTLTWTPRRRGYGGWLNGVELPATELSEQYLVQIYTTSGYTTVARSINVTSATTASYTAAQQTSDFGSPQATVYWDVAALGYAGWGYATRGVT